MLATIFLIILSAVYWVITPAALLRFYMQLLSLSFRNPLGQFVRAVTDWIVLPLRRIFRGAGYDWASLIAAYFLELTYLFLASLVTTGIAAYSQPLGIARWLVSGVFGLAVTVLALMIVTLLVYAVLSWVARERNAIGDVLAAMVAPWLRPIRRRMPLIGGIDLSPLVLCVLLQIGIVILQYSNGALILLIR
jgi:YggT family protein